MNVTAVDTAAFDSTTTRTPSRTVRVGWLIVAVLTMLSYNSWVAWEPLNGNPAILHGYLSELAAVDQPHHLFFRVGDLITTGLLLVTAITGLNWVRRDAAGRWWTAAYGALVLLAASIAAGAVFPMDCSPSLEPACAAAELAGQVSFTHELHTVAGVGVEIGLITALATGAVLMRKIGRIRACWLLLGMAVLEIAGLLVITGFATARIQEIAYPQIVTVLNASATGALAAVGHAFPQLRHPRGDR